MTEDVSFGFMLMAVGMVTVFSILALVVLGGNVLIWLVNKFDNPDNSTTNKDGISPSKIAAIAAAVQTVTQGHGRITNIEKQK